MDRHILALVESNTSGSGRVFPAAARALGLRPVMLAADARRYPFAGELEVVEVDTGSVPEVVAACRLLAPVVGVVSSSEYYIRTAALAAAALHLPGPDPAAVGSARDKGEQRRVLAAGGVRMPEFVVATTVEQALAAAAAIGCPVVVKPVAGSGSVGVRLCRDLEGVAGQAGELLAAGHDERGRGVPRRILVEAFADGPEYSVEIFGGLALGVTGKHLGPPPCFVEIGHDFPAQVEDAVRTSVIEAAEAAVRLLGLTFGPTHVELRVTAEGPSLIEVNPRLAGGWIPRLVETATGIDLIRETIRVFIGRRACLTPTRRGAAALRFVLAPGSGTLDGLRGLAEAGRGEGIVEAVAYRDPGAEVAVHGDFRDRIGHVLAAALTVTAAAATADHSVRAVHPILRATQEAPDDHPIVMTAPSSESLGDTGRLPTAVMPRIRQMLLEPERNLRPAWKDDLAQISRVDLAHVVMLAERGIIDRQVAGRLLETVLDLRRDDFAAIEGRAMPRGLYLAYEGYLIESLGADVGGVLHTGRSRNDLGATCFQLGLRVPYARLCSQLAALGVVLLGRARRYRATLMPAHTHFQGAVPITFGHYLLGLATALERDLAALLAGGGVLDRCPLGAGAVGGTSIPIDTGRTAALLGFTGPALNSVDAVASRDAALRLLGAAVVAGVTLDRAALDLLLWSSREYGYLTVPDSLVGSSSMMPQKRNAFVLEHVQGRTAHAAGAFVTGVAAMRGTSFTNSISVGTEGVAPTLAALQATADAVEILRLVVAGVRPNPEAMSAATSAGLTEATAVAEWLVRQGTPFRRAHYEVGVAVRAVLGGGAVSLWDALGRPEKWPSELAPGQIWQAASFGGGPGPASFDAAFGVLADAWLAHRAALADRRARWAAADAELDEAVHLLLKEANGP